MVETATKSEGGRIYTITDDKHSLMTIFLK